MNGIEIQTHVVDRRRSALELAACGYRNAWLEANGAGGLPTLIYRNGWWLFRPSSLRRVRTKTLDEMTNRLIQRARSAPIC